MSLVYSTTSKYNNDKVSLYQTPYGYEVWSNDGRTVFKCDSFATAYREYNFILGKGGRK